MVKKLPFKYLLKLHSYPFLAMVANKFGISWSSLGKKKYSVFTVIAQAKKLLNRTKFGSSNDKTLDIIMLTMLGGHYFTINVEILLGIALRKRGHKVRYVIDDQTLPINEHHHVGKEKEWAEVSAKDYAFGKKYLTTLGFEVLHLSEMIHNQDEVDISRFKHIIEATLLRHYRVGVLDSEIEDYDLKKTLAEDSIQMTAKLGNRISEMKPDRVIMSHGIYSTWGPPREILNENGIPVITYAETKKKDTIKLNWKKSSDIWDVDEEWEKIKDIDLLPEKELSIDNYLKSRISHKNDVLVYNFGNLETKEKTYKRFHIDPNKLVYTLFTNVLWDAASAQKELVFKNAIDWVINTIDWFTEHPEKQLIVKIHPAEVVIGTKQPFVKIIKKSFPKLPSNVLIIEPQEKVNSWSIYSITDLGLVHTSTPGLELPLLGKPCAVVSNVYYRNKSFTIDISNQQEYFQLLENFNPTDVDNEMLKVMSKRYAYIVFECYQIPFPFIKSLIKLHNVVGWNINTINDFLEHDSTNFILDAIEDKSSLVPLNLYP